MRSGRAKGDSGDSEVERRDVHAPLRPGRESDCIQEEENGKQGIILYCGGSHQDFKDVPLGDNSHPKTKIRLYFPPIFRHIPSNTAYLIYSQVLECNNLLLCVRVCVCVSINGSKVTLLLPCSVRRAFADHIIK